MLTSRPHFAPEMGRISCIFCSVFSPKFGFELARTGNWKQNVFFRFGECIVKARAVLREDHLISFINELYDGDLPRQAGLVAGPRYARSPHQCLLGRPCHWTRIGPRPWNIEQTWGEAGRPTAQQSHHRAGGLLFALGTTCDRSTRGDRGGLGLDELCSRRARYVDVVDAHRAWSGHGRDVGDGLDGDVERQPQPLRGTSCCIGSGRWCPRG